MNFETEEMYTNADISVLVPEHEQKDYYIGPGDPQPSVIDIPPIKRKDSFLNFKSSPLHNGGYHHSS